MHAPFFPVKKDEAWWVVLTEVEHKHLITVENPLAARARMAPTPCGLTLRGGEPTNLDDFGVYVIIALRAPSSLPLVTPVSLLV